MIQEVTPVLKKDTLENMVGKTFFGETTTIDSIQVAPMDSLVIFQDTLIVPILPDSTVIDTIIK